MTVFSSRCSALRRVCAACAIFTLLVLFLHHGAFAADTVLTLEPLEPETPAEPAPPPQTKWNLSADSLSTLGDNTIIEAKGGVVLSQNNDVLKADFARYYTETGWVYLKGNVSIKSKSDTLYAQNAEFDLRSQTGWLHNGQIFVSGSHMYIRGNEITKHEGDRYTFTQARITTCDGDSPAWSVTAGEAMVELDGYARLYHSRVAIKDLEFVYSPFLVLPAKTTRQSGLLLPDYGYSTRRGMYLTQPYYWAIDDTSDATFYAGYMTKRGPSFGIEYRSQPYTQQKSWFIFSGMKDRDIISTPGADPVFPGSSYVRTNHERFWIRGMSDGYIGASGWQYRMNLDYASDQDYLREFSSGLLGFNRSRGDLFSAFGRDLAEDYKNRVSEGIVFRDWNRFGLAAGLRYEQNPTLGHGNTPRSLDTITQRLPELNAFMYKSALVPGFPLEAEAQFSSAYMYRRLGTSGMRTEFFPKVSLPLDLKFLSVIPTFGVRQTWYNATTVDRSRDALDSPAIATDASLQGASRTMPEIDIQAFTDANQIWTLDNPAYRGDGSDKGPFAGWVGLRHDIQARARYQHTKNDDQADNPFYIDDDRILTTNELTYSITNILTRKRAVVKKTPKAALPPLEGTTDAPPPPKENVDYDYLDVLRWKIQWGYDFNEAHRNEYRDIYYARRPMKDVLSEFTVTPVDWFSYTGRTFISPYDGEISRHDHTVTFRWENYLSWSTGLDFRTEDYNFRERLRTENRRELSFTTPVKQLTNLVVIHPTPNWSLSFYDARNLDAPGNWGRGYKKAFTLGYSAQCYRILFEYRYDDYDKSYTVLFQIPGLFE